jgi:hypothetical protein
MTAETAGSVVAGKALARLHLRLGLQTAAVVAVAEEQTA